MLAYRNSAILFLFLFLSMHSEAQHRLGLQIMGGVNQMETDWNMELETYTLLLAPYAAFGAFYQYELSEHWTAGCDVQFQQLYAKEKVGLPLRDQNNQVMGEIYNTYNRQFLYYSMPVYIAYSWNDWQFQFGWQTSWLLGSSARLRSEFTENGTLVQSDIRYDDVPVKDLDFGPRFGLAYQITDRWQIESLCYQGIAQVALDNARWEARIWHVGLGVRYGMGALR